MTRPVLGIIACTRQVGTEPAQAVINRYVTAALRHADASGLIVPSLPDLIDARDVAARLDGLLLTGSPSNVAPELYGKDVPGDGPFDPSRDAMTTHLVDAMLELGRPVFGICRGFQELNVYFGGTLRGDTSIAGAELPHHAPADVPTEAMFEHGHPVELTSGGWLERLYGAGRLNVNSVHYQGIDQLASGLTIEAVAPDGLVEAFSTERGGAPVVAVQWHPEWGVDANIESQAYFQMLGRALRGQPLARTSSQ